MQTTLLTRLISLAFTSAIAMLCLSRPASAQPFEWQSATPKSQGMSKEKLDALKDELAKRKTRAFLVIRNDKIVYEWYAAGHGPNKKHGTASLAKATVAGLALALLVSDGKLKLDTPVAELVAAWKDDPHKRKITLRHLGSTRPTTPLPSRGTKHRSCLSRERNCSTAIPESPCCAMPLPRP